MVVGSGATMADPGWRKNAFQGLIFFGSFLVLLGTLGHWYFGDQQDKAKERTARQREESLTKRLEAIQAGINELVAQGRLSKQDAQRLLQITLTDTLPLGDSVRIEVTRPQGRE